VQLVEPTRSGLRFLITSGQHLAIRLRNGTATSRVAWLIISSGGSWIEARDRSPICRPRHFSDFHCGFAAEQIPLLVGGLIHRMGRRPPSMRAASVATRGRPPFSLRRVPEPSADRSEASRLTSEVYAADEAGGENGLYRCPRPDPLTSIAGQKPINVSSLFSKDPVDTAAAASMAYVLPVGSRASGPFPMAIHPTSITESVSIARVNGDDASQW
jgi:hypothetical protein